MQSFSDGSQQCSLAHQLLPPDEQTKPEEVGQAETVLSMALVI